MAGSVQMTTRREDGIGDRTRPPLFTSAFLTLEIIRVVYTYWRWAQLKRERKGASRAVA